MTKPDAGGIAAPNIGGGWYPTFMKKTSLYLDPDTDAALTRLAEQQGISKAELIRRALRETAASAPRPRIAAIGVGSGPGDVSDDVDRHLADTGFGNA